MSDLFYFVWVDGDTDLGDNIDFNVENLSSVLRVGFSISVYDLWPVMTCRKVWQVLIQN